MRLICPNCDAQYEVDSSAVPETGRDVQCSNCGHTWFQMAPDIEAEEEAEEALFGAIKAQLAPGAQSGHSHQADHAVKIPQPESPARTPATNPAAPEPERDAPSVAAGVASQSPAEDPAVPKRRGLDESLMNILREEAEREAAVRKNEGQKRPIETQVDMGLEEPAAGAGAARALKDRLARLRGEEDDTEAEMARKPAARRDLLPDIEEINSTLRASNENRPGEDDDDDEMIMRAEPRRSRSGFRSGFSLVMLLVVILGLAYAAAPQIARYLPATEGAITAYVALVDKGRVWLDGAMRRATSGLQEMSGSEGN